MSYRVLNLGAGVQSSAMLLMTIAGELPAVDVAIFADTGWEPAEVYAHLARLEEHAAGAGIRVERVTAGNLRDHALARGVPRAISIPVYMAGTEARGLARRQCTRDYKIRPIRRRARELMLAAGQRKLVNVFGISADEAERMRDPDAAYVTNEYPLVWAGITRADCERWMADAGWAAPRSACIACPFHNDAEWRRIRERPEEWADAVRFEKELQEHSSSYWRGTPYLHRSRVPLDQVDLSTPEDRGQGTLDSWGDECEGMCGV